MKNIKLLKNPIAQGLALALGSSMLSSPLAMSQEEERVLEEVVVTGIRSSLNRSADIKRFSDGVVDAISAEDIGAFPDSNLAESLQRITGVSIDRSRGEGSKVTVRGFGPEYNLVTLNGRQMPTNSELNRSFDFADIAAEGVSGVEVYKTSNASLPTGGIGATINIKTIKPLEQNERIFTVGMKAVHDTSVVDGDDVNPEISALFSDTFADGTFGIALSGSYQDRDNAVESGKSRGWLPHRGDTQCCDWNAANADWGAVPFNDNQVNRTTENGEIYSTPQNLLYIQEEFSRKRINGQLTLQWEPVENLTATLDYTYSEVELERTFKDLSAWFIFGDAEVRSEWTDGPVAGPREYSEFYGNPLDIPYGAGIDSTKNENDSIGFNVEWRPTETLTLAFDYHDSSAESTPDSDLGSEMSLAITTARRTSARGYFGSDLPILELGLLDDRPLSPDDMLIGGSVFTNTINAMDIEQAKISGSWAFSDIANIDFGIQTTEVDNRHATSTVQRDTWGGVGSPGDISDLLTPSSLSGWFDDFSDDSRRYTQAFDWNTNALIQRARELAASGVTVSNASTIPGDCGDGFCPSTSYTTDKRTQEDQIAAYAQLDMDLEWGDMPVNLLLGLRYEETEVDSQALVPVIDRIDWITSNETPTVTRVDENGVAVQDFTDLDGDYDNWLPNVDFNIEFIQDVLFRASYSKTMARPNYNDVQGGLLVGECRPNEGCTGSAGDPALEPLESDNYDLSLEWYYAEGSYAAIGYFYKDVENFIGSSFAEDVVLFPDLTMPTEGGLAAQARAGGATTNDEIRDYIFTNFANDPTVDVENQIISGGADNNSARFLVTVPTNQEDATIDGIELAIQHTFGESGFGIIANYTYVDGDVEYNDLSTETQFALFGLSDSANLVGFYDKHGIEVRVAYNWRDEFLSGIGHDSFGAQPRYTEEYGQWDIRASYRFGAEDNYTVFFEGLNVTEETWREHGRAEEDVLAASQWGARYALGFRYKF
jgi:TonB-dependent receptor